MSFEADDSIVNVTDRPAQISKHSEKLRSVNSQRVDIGPSRLLNRPTQVLNEDKGCESADANQKHPQQQDEHNLRGLLDTTSQPEEMKSEDVIVVSSRDIELRVDDHKNSFLLEGKHGEQRSARLSTKRDPTLEEADEPTKNLL